MGKESKPTFGVIFWIALLCLVAVLYLGSRISFPRWIAERFGGDYRDAPEAAIPAPVPHRDEPAPPPPPAEIPDAVPKAPIPVQPEQPLPPPEIVASKPAPEPARTRVAKLYFVRVTDNGSIELVPVERSIPFNSTPLRETIKELLKGPTPAETEAGILTLIPSNTGLRSIRIRDGIAFIDLNDYFRYNPLGAEGFRSQIQQIVHTATEFPNLQAVQFLIGGRTLAYLSPEGVFIGRPIRR